MPRYPSHVVISFVIGLAMIATIPSPNVRADEIDQWSNKEIPSLVELYRELHSHPELSLFEEKTAARMAQELKAAGCEVTTGIGGHGVVGMLSSAEGANDGKLIMLRADMDALPVREKTELPYASKVTVDGPSGDVGVMHACGHDIHMTNLIGVARYLAAHRKAWKGRVMFLCQPAEERVAGAQAMIEDGLFEKLGRPDMAIALHVDAVIPTGKVGVSGGFTLANVDSLDITVLGKGGHGAGPHNTIDPIVIAAQLIVSLQTIVSREIKPTEPAVVTVGSIHGGSKHNIIDDRCHLQLTIRSYSDEVHEQILKAIERKAKAAAMAAGAPEPIIKRGENSPSLYNDEELAARLREVFQKLIGKENVVPCEKSMGAEDFSRFGKAGIPIVMYKLGSVSTERLARYKEQGGTVPSLHSPLYYPDADQSLKTGVRTMAGAVVELLRP